MLRRILPLLGVMMLALTAMAQSWPAGAAHANDGFVTRHGNVLKVNGRQFRFAGANNYYLMYKSPFMVDDVLNAAAANGFRVMRIWGSLDIGDPNDPATSIRGPADGVYFQYWDPAAGAPAYNDGPNGLQRLDYVVYRAGQLGLKLVIPFVNNWNDFGGMDQYVRWRDRSTPDDQVWYHDSFYTDPIIRQWYKNWIAHLLNRTNSYTGVPYKDDPTIMTWELANEPRCLSAGAYPRSPNCTPQTLIAWADELSTFVKSIDANHLVSVGDEGFYCLPHASHWTESCGEGVDTIAFTRLPNIDVMSFHLYPDSWGTDAAWGTEWIRRHIRDAKANGKAVMLGEFGLRDQRIRNKVYKAWTDAVFKSGGQSGSDGALYWILSARQDNGALYPDYDGFTVYRSNPVFITLGNFARMMAANRSMGFPPVADDDTAVVAFNTPQVTLNPPANDITYGGATLQVRSIDLDPSMAGQQTTRSVIGGTFQAQPDGTVVVSPEAGFDGKVTITYTIRDSLARLSNPARLSITVNPDPNGPLRLFSFEEDTEGWAANIGSPNAGTLAQSAAFHTHGAFSLQIDTTAGGGWLGRDLASPVDLSAKPRLKFDLRTGMFPNPPGGTSIAVVVKTVDWNWCQKLDWGFIPANTPLQTIEVDLTQPGCIGNPANPYDIRDIRAIFIYLNGGGTVYIDNVRAE